MQYFSPYCQYLQFANCYLRRLYPYDVLWMTVNAVHVRVPAEIAGVDVEYPGSRDGGRRGSLEVTDLKQHAHRRRQRDPLIAGQRQHLVVVHHRVE